MVPVKSQKVMSLSTASFDLVEGEGMRGVGIVAAIDLAGTITRTGWLLLFHGANLHGDVCVRRRSGVFALLAIRDRKCPCVADRWYSGCSGFEIVVRAFRFLAFDDGEADGNEILRFPEDLADQVMGADGANDAGEREVDPLTCRAVFSERTRWLRGAFRFVDSTCARSSFREAPTARFNSSVAGSAIVRDLREYAGLAAEPGIAELFPEDSSCAEAAIVVEASTEVSEERRVPRGA